MKYRLLILALALLACGAASAEIHRWVDKDGNVHFGDTIPPEYANQNGNADPAKQGPESTAVPAGHAQEIERRREMARQQEADRILLKTYLSVEEIESVRDDRIGQLQSRDYVTERYLERLNEQLAELETAAIEYAAANSEPGKPAELPADLERDILSTRSSIKNYEGRLEASQAEQERIREKFATDIARFRELKGLPPENEDG
ncbi:MAG: DUF4124 domain-containing protein [Gammaproteobacteria bacterium]|nr:MAG: DUF4124 domain-containing protein [Gammaproteobacteria bacterium]